MSEYLLLVGVGVLCMLAGIALGHALARIDIEKVEKEPDSLAVLVGKLKEGKS